MTKKFIILFVVLNFFLSVFYLDTWQNGNTTARAIAVVAFAETHSLQIDKRQEESVDKIFINGHYYCGKAPLPLFIVIPFFEIVNLFHIAPENLEHAAYITGDILCGSIPFTLIILFSFLFIRKINTSTVSPVLLSMLPFYASFIFIYTGTFYGHMVAALFLLLSYITLRFQKNYFWSGVFCGLAFASEFPIAIIFLIWAMQIYLSERSFKPAIKFALGILPSLIFIGVYNYFLSGNIFNLPYKYDVVEENRINYGFSFPKADAMWGLSFSPYRGIFLYAPFLILIFYEMIKLYLQKPLREIFSTFVSNYLIVAVIIIFLFISSYFEWSGGWCYGPRQLFIIAVLLCFEGVTIFSTQKFFKPMFWLLIAFGLISTFMAKSTIVYSVPSDINNPFTGQVIPNFIKNNFNPNNILTMVFNISPKVANYIWLICFLFSIIALTFLFKKEKENSNVK